LDSILAQGIRDPLRGVDAAVTRILLDGLERCCCARELAIEIVPFCASSQDKALGIIELIRIANAKKLSILEQAKLTDELNVSMTRAYRRSHGCWRKARPGSECRERGSFGAGQDLTRFWAFFEGI